MKPLLGGLQHRVRSTRLVSAPGLRGLWNSQVSLLLRLRDDAAQIFSGVEAQVRVKLVIIVRRL